MTYKYIPAMEVINRAHAFKNAIPCINWDHDIDPYLSTSYMQDGLYIVWDAMLNCFFFIDAGSPQEAIEKVKTRWDEANQAGQYVPEEYE